MAYERVSCVTRRRQQRLWHLVRVRWQALIFSPNLTLPGFVQFNATVDKTDRYDLQIALAYSHLADKVKVYTTYLTY